MFYNEASDQLRLLGIAAGGSFWTRNSRKYLLINPPFRSHNSYLFQSTSSTTTTSSTTSAPTPFLYPTFPEDAPQGNDTIDPSIVLGQRAAAGEIPWQAFLIETRSNGDQYICGGSLVRPTWVFTAAHCIYNPGTTEVRLGGTNIQRMPYAQTASRRIYHQSYNPNTLENDVGLLKLPMAASGTGIAPIPFAPSSVGTLQNVALRASGYGNVNTGGPSSPDLLKVTLRGISNAECQRTFGSTIKTSTLCANWNAQRGESICQGDSGGPLTARLSNGQDVLAGVVSFTGGSCTQGLPQGFARVTSFSSWAENTMNSN